MDNQISDREFEAIRHMVYDYTGIKLSEQKRAMIQSRLFKRLRQLGCASFEQYVRTVTVNPQEKAIMFNLLTTNVTKFFREAHHFEFIADKFLPWFIKTSAQTKPLRVWSAGCSTGQEPYTLAIVLEEYFARRGGREFRILASDINTEVLKKAVEGVYTWEEVCVIPYNLLKKYFDLGTGVNSGLFKVKPKLRKKVSFEYYNLAESKGGSGFPNAEQVFDIIFCRNVFIYFDQKTKASAIKMFYNSLSTGGCLFLGHSESLNLSDPQLGRWSLQDQTVYRKEP